MVNFTAHTCPDFKSFSFLLSSLLYYACRCLGPRWCQTISKNNSHCKVWYYCLALLSTTTDSTGQYFIIRTPFSVKPYNLNGQYTYTYPYFIYIYEIMSILSGHLGKHHLNITLLSFGTHGPLPSCGFNSQGIGYANNIIASTYLVRLEIYVRTMVVLLNEGSAFKIKYC